MSRLNFFVLLGLLLAQSVVAVCEEQAEPPKKTEPKPVENKPDTDDDIEFDLVKVVRPEGTPETPGDLLDQTVNQMRDISRLIQTGKAGKETQDQQQKVVDDISKLIELLQNQPPPQSSSNSNNNNQQQQQNQNNQQSNSNPDQQNQNSPQDQPQQQNQDQQKQQQQQQQDKQEKGERSDKANDSEERLDEARAAKARAAARERMLKDIWGHLPEAVRNRLRNTFSEEYLPKYAPEVRAYFEDLAKRRREENR